MFALNSKTPTSAPATAPTWTHTHPSFDVYHGRVRHPCYNPPSRPCLRVQAQELLSDLFSLSLHPSSHFGAAGPATHVRHREKGHNDPDPGTASTRGDPNSVAGAVAVALSRAATAAESEAQGATQASANLIFPFAAGEARAGRSDKQRGGGRDAAEG